MNTQLPPDEVGNILHYLRDKGSKKLHSDKYKEKQQQQLQDGQSLHKLSGAQSREHSLQSSLDGMHINANGGHIQSIGNYSSLVSKQHSAASQIPAKAAAVKLVVKPLPAKKESKKASTSNKVKANKQQLQTSIDSNSDDYLDVLVDKYGSTPAANHSRSSYTSADNFVPSSADSNSDMLLLVTMNELEKPCPAEGRKKRRGKMLEVSQINPVQLPPKKASDDSQQLRSDIFDTCSSPTHGSAPNLPVVSNMTD